MRVWLHSLQTRRTRSLARRNALEVVSKVGTMRVVFLVFVASSEFPQSVELLKPLMGYMCARIRLAVRIAHAFRSSDISNALKHRHICSVLVSNGVYMILDGWMAGGRGGGHSQRLTFHSIAPILHVNPSDLSNGNLARVSLVEQRVPTAAVVRRVGC